SRPMLRLVNVARFNLPGALPRSSVRSASRPSARSVAVTEVRILFRVTLFQPSPIVTFAGPATVVLLRVKVLTLAPTVAVSGRPGRRASGERCGGVPAGGGPDREHPSGWRRWRRGT